ncbi:MAG TPA: hypothetical protein DEA55_03995 [Rhodospirillaceae bacterium]|nr:hypothetical protein [Rhodospirillaceae bacterium]
MHQPRGVTNITKRIITEKISIYASKNQALAALLSKPEKAAFVAAADGEEGAARPPTLAIMAHDFPGHKAGNNDIFADIELLLVEKGFHTLRFDFRGCGESDGARESFTMSGAMEDFQQVMHWGRDQGFRNYILIGEGLGASLAALNCDIDVKALVLLWPALDTKLYADNVFGEPDQEARQKGYIEKNGCRASMGFLEELKKANLIKGLQDVRAPTLILHGAEDEILPIEQLDLARKHMRSDRIEITTFHDGGHGLRKLNHRKMVFYHITQFAEKYA